MITKCPICDLSASVDSNTPGIDSTIFNCNKCGKFNVSRSLLSSLPKLLSEDKYSNIKLSHSIKKMQQNNDVPVLTSEIIKEILNQPLPTPKEQADNFIRWLAESINIGESIHVEFKIHGSVMGAKTNNGFALVVIHLIEIGLLKGKMDKMRGEDYEGYITLSLNGWDYYDKLKKVGGSYHQAFMAMKFGDSNLDDIVENIFKPYVKHAGFNLIKLNNNPKAGLIDNRMRVEIQNSDFLIADLTHDNNGAYWEAGYAEGLGKPVIYTCEKEKFDSRTTTHFDTNHHLTIKWDKNSPEQAGEELKATIRATLPLLAKMKDDSI